MVAIKVNNVHKKFKVYYDKGSSLKEKLLFRNRSYHEDRWVLKGINFEVQKGEAIGIIGENGCGKSTLLKLLAQIMYPNKGNIEINGRVSSLIELGAGFHPDMSGRENIYTNAAIFGLTKREIDNRLHDIIGFSELEDYIDNPVRTYSSGMYMRLAFSVAINVDADILLIDEILAVGDANFQTKCFNKMQEIKKAGTTIIIVSHSMAQIEQICDRTIWLKNGIIQKIGNVRDVSFAYLDYIMNKNEEVNFQKRDNEIEATANSQIDDFNNDAIVEEKRWGNRKIEITGIKILNEQGEKIDNFKTGDNITVSVEFIKNVEINQVDEIVVGVGIVRNDDILVYGTNTRIEKIPIIFKKMIGNVRLNYPTADLLPGHYYLDVAIEEMDTKPLDYYREAIFFNVYSNVGDIGVSRLQHKWHWSDHE